MYFYPYRDHARLSSSNIWAGIKHKVQVGMCIQWRFRSVCTSAQSDQSLRFPPKETLDIWLPKECPSKTLIRLRRCLLACTVCGNLVHLINEFNFWNVHGIMNTSGLMQSKWSRKGFTLTLQETRSIHDSMNIPKMNLLLIFTFYIISKVSILNFHLFWLVVRIFWIKSDIP